MEENLFTKDCIRTFSGKYVNVFAPKPEMFCIIDVAHALSNICRFGGHLPTWYSVAAHSVWCASQMSSPQDAYDALMHDCTEAYLCDIPSPIKNRLPDYKQLEASLNNFLSRHFGYNIHKGLSEVQAADQNALVMEWDMLMLNNSSKYYEAYSKHSYFIKLSLMSPLEARAEFLGMYSKLRHQLFWQRNLC